MRHIFLITVASLLFFIANPGAAQASATGDHAYEMAELEKQREQLSQQISELEQNKADLDSQYQSLSGSRLLHRVLQEQRSMLPDAFTVDYHDRLAELRLQLFYTQRQLREAEQLAPSQAAALRQQRDTLEEHIALIVEVHTKEQQFGNLRREFGNQLDEYLFWTPSNPSMNWAWWQSVPERIQQQFGTMQSAVQLMVQNTHVRLTSYVFFLLLALAAVIYKRPYLKEKIDSYSANIKDPDFAASPWVVPGALIKIALYVMPGTLVLLIIGQFIQSPPEAEHLNPGAAFTALAFAWFVLSFLHKLTKPTGFAHLYFDWPQTTCASVRKFIRLLGAVLLPLTFILAFATQQTSLFGQDVVGSLALLFASIYLLALVIWIFQRIPPLYDSRYIHRSIAFVVALLPITLIYMVTTGFYYTALKLSGYYLATFYVLAAWIISEASIYRAINFSTQRLQKQQEEQQKELLALAEIEDDSEQAKEIPEPEVDPLRAHQQAIRLARFLLLIVFAFVLFAVWSDAMVALEYLDTQFIWQDGDEVGVLPISFGGLFSTIFIIVVSVILVRNLPGLLEMLVLSRLNLEMGTSYAVTSLLNYVLVGIAIVAIFSALGLQWAQLQWLAAGLTVGLGFGLQAIFANFISGLILFFERPVRVGDIVTLDNLSGRVSKIRIRATVITDFDRRDIVVPNQNFITSKFVNWSLSNTVTRITVKVGIAYGSDLEKAREILLDIAEKEPRILPDPPPQVLFLSFGESTLDHEIRVHVGALKDRNPTIDAVNREIDRRFKEAGIEIAFNQIDVHFRNELGFEKLVEQRGPKETPSEDK
ncbi:mechanosensitive ion channel [Aliidiomarina halalkaliphila]|uniref:Mechanosensitive ion channel n=1 Tax=Aliidiomarina halalkaliphila TaxID=2593535 RepID=A0A552X4N9_9GAMM|nr:mechanosensitive ion channel domain-containing protein [Aliidiomarina halalkaliphila]TRW49889.1 mechanosensitive ion channel [Aliidiomarina halalkaliphila]